MRSRAPRLRLRSAAVAVCLLIGCSGGSTSTFLALPESEGIRAIVVDVTRDGTRVVHAANLEGGWSIRASEGSQIDVFGYRQTLVELGLSEGEITSDLPAEDCRLAFPTLALSVGDGTRWLSTTLSREFRDRLVAPGLCRFCTGLEPRLVRMASGGRIWAAAQLSSGAALVAHTGGSGSSGLLRVDHDGTEEVEGCGVPYAISGGQDNRFWMVQWGPLVRVRIEESTLTCVVETSTQAAAGLRFGSLATSEPDESFELFIVDQAGTLHRFDGEVFETLMALELHPSQREEGVTKRGRVVRLGPREAIFLVGWDQVAWWRDGESRVQRLALTPEAGGLEHVVAIGMTGSKTPIVGGSAGELFALSWDQSPVPLEGSPLSNEVGAILPWGRGFLASDANGHVARFHDGGEFCPNLPPIFGSTRGRAGGAAFVTSDFEVFFGDFSEPEGEPHGMWLTFRDD